MTDLFHAGDNATPLTEAEHTDLIPTHISLRSELNDSNKRTLRKRMCEKKSPLSQPHVPLSSCRAITASIS
jgi:hypothetical protein